MYRSKRLLILLTVLIAACAAAFLALNWQQRQEQIQTSGEEVLTIDPDSVQSLAWTCGETSLSFTRDGEGTWSYDEDAAFPVDPEAMEALLAPFAPFSAAFVIEEAEDESQYGLDDPACTDTNTTEEETYEIRLGDTSAVDGQRYLSFGDGTVYLAADDPLETYEISLSDCILNDEVPVMDQVTAIAFSGEEDYEVSYLEDGSAYSPRADDLYFTERDGDTLPLDTDRVETYLSALATLNLTDYTTYSVTDAELEQFGLDDPELTVTVDYTSEDEDGADRSGTFTLHISRDPDQRAQAEESAGTDESADTDEEEAITAYARVGDSSIVYVITELEYTDLMAATYNDLRHREVLTADFADVLSLGVTLEGETYTFTVQGEGEDAVWSWNDQEIDFADLQAAVEALSAEEFTDEAPGDQLEISFTAYLDNESFPQVEVVLYRYDGSSCLAMVDGEPVCLVDRADVVSLMEAVRAIVLSDHGETEA